MKKTIIITCLLCTVILASHAQKEAYNWYFGNKAGLTWNSTRSLSAQGLYGTTNATLNMPAALTGSLINTDEGCFTISDAKGNLICYSDGSTVWDKTHAVMPGGTGFSGDYTSAQSGIAFPYPDSSDKYVIITVSRFSTNSMMYGIIDMNPVTNGGYANGAVTGKGTFEGHTGKLGESVSTIRHANKRDYWVVAPGTGSGTSFMNAWLVTPSGVQYSNPEKSMLPVDIPSIDGNNGAMGYLKFSKDGSTFLWGTGTAYVNDYGYLFIGDFNPGTAGMTNIKYRTLKKDPPISSPSIYVPIYYYSTEFSLSGKYLYVSSAATAYDQSFLNTTCWTLLEVFDIAELKSDPQNAVPKVFFEDDRVSGALQLTPDGRIFHSIEGSGGSGGNINTATGGITVIENPDKINDLKIYHLRNSILFTSGGTAMLGLPNFSASFWNFPLSGPESFCVNTNQSFSIEIIDTDNKLSYTKWDFGDGSTIETGSNNPTQSRSHTYTKRGHYTITVSLYDAGDNKIEEETLRIKVNACRLPVNHNLTTVGN